MFVYELVAEHVQTFLLFHTWLLPFVEQDEYLISSISISFHLKMVAFSIIIPSAHLPDNPLN